MRDRELQRLKTELGNAFDRVDEIDPGAIQLQGEYARYLCVRTSGFLEVTVKYMLAEFVRRSSFKPAVARYVASRVERHQSMKGTQLLDLVGSFDPAWRTSLEAFLDMEHKDALDSVVTNRHAIAHGRPTGISFVRVQRYYELVLEIAEFLEDMILPASSGGASRR
jgi:hypothetical protein